jgi:hypothetical protein
MTFEDKRSQMTAMVDLWRQSGLSQTEFSHLQNVKLATLRYWIHKQRQGDTGSGFIQLNGLPSSGISIRYPNGVELMLPAQVPAGYLKMLINI